MKAKRQNRTLSVSVTMLDGSGGHVTLKIVMYPQIMPTACSGYLAQHNPLDTQLARTPVRDMASISILVWLE
jgi:hypothetical protein